MKLLYTSVLLLIISLSASAQMYEKAIGVRMGHSTGIFFDKQNDDLSTYRFMMSNRDDGRHFTAMKLFRKYNYGSLPDYMSVYYGYGAHVGYIRWNERIIEEDSGYYVRKHSAPVIGFDILIGLSYDFDHLPISLTADVKPFFDIWGKNTLNIKGSDFAIGAIYTF